MVRTQLYIFVTQNSILGIQLHVSACILAIVRLYCKLNKQLYNMCVGYSGGTRSRLTLVDGMVFDHCGPVLTL